jgi:hypothetical protein
MVGEALYLQCELCQYAVLSVQVPCVNNNAYVNFAGPLSINHALTPNGDGTWRYAVCKPNIAPYNQSTSSCANKNPLP